MLPAGTDLSDLLQPLLQDPDPQVASAAARSAGSIGGQEQLASIVPLLGKTATRRAARLALQSRGDDAIPVLLAAALDQTLEPRARMSIPHVLSGIDSPEAMATLARLLNGDDVEMTATTSHALYRVRLKKPDGAMIPTQEARDLILGQADRCSQLYDQIQALDEDEPALQTKRWTLMLSSLRSAYARHHLAVFQTLCLCYSPRHIVNCRRSLLDQNLELRANAAELLDNLVPRKMWRELLPVLYREEFASKRVESEGNKLTSERAIKQLLKGDNRWLAVCAEHLSDERNGDVDSSKGETMGALSVVEKVVALQEVEVFRGTPSEQLALIAAVAEEVQLPPETSLAEQDDPPGDMFVILEGSVALVRDGNPLGTLKAGDALGTWGLFEDDPQQVSAKTVTETRALRIDRWGFDEAIDEHPDIARSLIRQLIRRMRRLAG
jgi:hypothetical protein